VQFFAHNPFVVNNAIHSTSRQEVTKKNIHCKFFAQTEFFMEKVQLKLMPHSQQLFTLHWYRRFRRNNDYSTYQHARQMEFSRGWGNNGFFHGVVKFDFTNPKLRERHFLTNNLNKLISNYNIHVAKPPTPSLIHAYQYTIKPNR